MNRVPGVAFTTLIFYVTYEWAQRARVLHYTRLKILAKDKNSSLFGPFISYIENEVLCIGFMGLYSQHFISCITDEWAQQARMLHFTWLEMLARDKHSSWLSQFESYKEIEVLWIGFMGLYSQHFISCITNKWAQRARVLHYTRLEMLERTKNSSLFGPFISYIKTKVLWIGFLGLHSQHSFFHNLWMGPTG